MKKLLFLGLIFLASAVLADSATYIVEFNAKKLYIYNDSGDELGQLKSSSLKSQFVAIPGQDRSGLPILKVDMDEGLLQVNVTEYAEPVWLETMAVETWPSARLKCPDATMGRAEVEQSGMTIGFGEHCEPAEQ
jgi:hypothetical protein